MRNSRQEMQIERNYLKKLNKLKKKVIEIQADPFGLENLKAAALADKAKKIRKGEN